MRQGVRLAGTGVGNDPDSRLGDGSVGNRTRLGLSVFKYAIRSARSALSPERLLRDHWLDGRSPVTRAKMSPRRSSRRAGFGGELPVALKIEIALHVADGKNETNLPTGGCHLRLKAANAIAGSAVARLWSTKLVVS
jgi:hypothetical protein